MVVESSPKIEILLSGHEQFPKKVEIEPADNFKNARPRDILQMRSILYECRPREDVTNLLQQYFGGDLVDVLVDGRKTIDLSFAAKGAIDRDLRGNVKVIPKEEQWIFLGGEVIGREFVINAQLIVFPHRIIFHTSCRAMIFPFPGDNRETLEIVSCPKYMTGVIYSEVVSIHFDISGRNLRVAPRQKSP